MCYDKNMNVLGIIAEYNPFHNGHLYHLQESRKKAEADFVVAVMSGNFTQRGEPALMDKWARSRLAVECGVDLVLELPFAYAVNSAEYFAKGGIGILCGLGCVTHLGFGAEQGSPGQLETIAGFLATEPQFFRAALKENLASGISYAKARETALGQALGPKLAALTTTPNNILALEYMKQLKKHDSSIKCIMVNRKGAGYHDPLPSGNIASASAIRSHIEPDQRKYYVPAPTAAELEQVPQTNGYFNLLRGMILQSTPQQLSRIFSVGEGLENRIKEQVRNVGSLEALVAAVKSKRYPETRIRRMFCQIVMGLETFEDTHYARVLATGERGTALLRRMKKTARIPVITNVNKFGELPALMDYDILAGDIYNLIAGRDLYEHCDYVRQPYIQRSYKLLDNPVKEDYNI